MKPVKLYYDSFPGKKLCYDEIQKEFIDMPTSPTIYMEWQPARYQFHDLLNELCIPWEWTDDPKQGMIVADIESVSPTNTEIVLDFFSSKFDKFIAASLTEARYGYLSDKVNRPMDKYPNVMFMDVSWPGRDCEFQHEAPRWLPFPTLLFRNTSTAMSGFLCHGEVNLEHPRRKAYDFNHLSYNCRLEKFIPHYYLFEKYKLSNCLFSFKPPSPQQANTILNAIEHRGIMYNVDPNDLSHMIKRLTSDPYQSIDLRKDLAFNINIRQHPEHLYTNTCISLVSESYHHDNIVFLTDKTMHPLLNCQPFVANGCIGYNDSLQKEFGFQIYDELFDHSFDEEESMFKRAEMIAKQAQSFDRAVLCDNLKTVAEKVQHNKNLLTNRNSSLFVKFRNVMLEYIDRYYSL
jgi:hypothetical protein